jgi:hypothetical protein
VADYDDWPLGEEPPYELLRLREVLDWLRTTRDEVESWGKNGWIRPLRKRKSAKALYLKWELCVLLGRPPTVQNQEPRNPKIRRADALAWLGVPAAEFESWVNNNVICAIRSDRGKAYYSVSEIKKKVLRQSGKRWERYCKLVETGPTPGELRYFQGRVYKWHSAKRR